MSTLRQALYGFALLASIALLIWAQSQRIEVADQKTGRAQDAADAAIARATRSEQTAAQLQASLQDERTAQAALRSVQDQLRQGLATRQRTIEDLKRENAELRFWADQPLPDAARRMRERPAITGAAAYRDWLSGRGALHPVGD
ncbi:Rz-like lysis system protein LysB [Pseudomonas arsenicoxydans]|uniref:LysB family phage lysis regulatory protein n=1 Tax=Pseudomonas arsenicoxydans TaxID=702115 RepID=A0A502HU50_9PSED|nr:Rz-like lysis system protein LysB [Pseudomonas arsenicoxydans]TPG77343.1 LysB family phage lysis regulatory protein [Pseudomonas arsenicoxydans]